MLLILMLNDDGGDQRSAERSRREGQRHREDGVPSDVENEPTEPNGRRPAVRMCVGLVRAHARGCILARGWLHGAQRSRAAPPRKPEAASFSGHLGQPILLHCGTKRDHYDSELT